MSQLDNADIQICTNAASVWPVYIPTLGLYDLWRRRQTLTLTPLAIVKRSGLVFKRERTLPLAKVQDVSFHAGILSGKVVITTAGGAAGVVTQTSKKWHAREFVAAVNETLGAA